MSVTLTTDVSKSVRPQASVAFNTKVNEPDAAGVKQIAEPL